MLRRETVVLQKQLAQEKLHNKVLTAMIEITETELPKITEHYLYYQLSAFYDN